MTILSQRAIGQENFVYAKTADGFYGWYRLEPVETPEIEQRQRKPRAPLQMAFCAYRQRYNLPATVAYTLARYLAVRHVTIHDGWLMYQRNEIPGLICG